MHAGATALLLAVFLGVVLWQRLTGPRDDAAQPAQLQREGDSSAAPAPAAAPDPAPAPSAAAADGTVIHVPRPAGEVVPAAASATAGASVLHWHVDLRVEEAADAPRELTRSS